MEHAEWLQLQKDLQVAVVVANDFRTEAQHSFDTVLAENQSLRDRVASLTKELAEVHHQLAATSKYLLCLNVIEKLLFYSSLRVCKSPCSEPVHKPGNRESYDKKSTWHKNALGCMAGLTVTLVYMAAVSLLVVIP